MRLAAAQPNLAVWGGAAGWVGGRRRQIVYDVFGRDVTGQAYDGSVLFKLVSPRVFL